METHIKAQHNPQLTHHSRNKPSIDSKTAVLSNIYSTNRITIVSKKQTDSPTNTKIPYINYIISKPNHQQKLSLNTQILNPVQNKAGFILGNISTRNAPIKGNQNLTTIKTPKSLLPSISPRESIPNTNKNNSSKYAELHLKETIKKYTLMAQNIVKLGKNKVNNGIQKNLSYQNPQSPTEGPTQSVSNKLEKPFHKIKSISLSNSVDQSQPKPKVVTLISDTKKNITMTTRNSDHKKMLSWNDAPKFRPKRMTPTEAISILKKELKDYELQEIQTFPDIYYVGNFKSKLPVLDPKAKNNGWDDAKGFYMVNFKDHLFYRYEILSLLGNGSFGHVFKCLDHKTNEQCAIKILRNKEKFHKQGKIEIDILKALNTSSAEEAKFVVEMKDYFTFRNHICIVFEILSIDLYELLKSSRFAGFKIPLIQAFARQLILVMGYMKRLGIIHCDLKPENILLKNHAKSAIKVIDFGTGCFENKTFYTYIQSRYYRAPEIILGIPYTCAIDMWSLGCILVELYCGYPIFAGEDEAEQLAIIMEYLGIPPLKLILMGTRSKGFFEKFQPIRIVNSKGQTRIPGSRSLEAFINCEDSDFVDFIRRCLEWVPDKRITPEEAKKHKWVKQQ